MNRRPIALPAHLRQVFLLLAIALSWPLCHPQALAEDPPQPTPAGQASAKPMTTPMEPPSPAPAGMILDQATVFRPENVRQLEAVLIKAKADGVHVYVVTIQSLKVPSSQQGNQIEIVAEQYAKAWTHDVVGAIIFFEDEGGHMTIRLSEEALRRFPGFMLEQTIDDSLKKSAHMSLSRDKLENAAVVVTNILSEFQRNYLRETRRQRISNSIMAVIALLGIALAIYSAVAQPKKNAPTE